MSRTTWKVSSTRGWRESADHEPVLALPESRPIAHCVPQPRRPWRRAGYLTVAGHRELRGLASTTWSACTGTVPADERGRGEDASWTSSPTMATLAAGRLPYRCHLQRTARPGFHHVVGVYEDGGRRQTRSRRWRVTDIVAKLKSPALCDSRPRAVSSRSTLNK
jgi:hypothetical protein